MRVWRVYYFCCGWQLFKGYDRFDPAEAAAHKLLRKYSRTRVKCVRYVTINAKARGKEISVEVKNENQKRG